VNIAVADDRNTNIPLERGTVIIMGDLLSFFKDTADLGCDSEN
jgi:hypothetical protein